MARIDVRNALSILAPTFNKGAGKARPAAARPAGSDVSVFEPAGASRDVAIRERTEARFAGDLLDDASLRRGRSDAEFQGQMDVAMAQIHRLASTVKNPGSPEADAKMQALVERIRTRLKGA